MKKTLEELIDEYNNKIESLPSEAEQDKERRKLHEWIHTYEVARQLEYGNKVLEKILNARNNIHAGNILIDARRAC